jgi:cytochrome d ubiquinol oxidase subunit II
MEFRGKVESPGWRRFWDWSFALGSLLPAILFGVAVGNILRGVPINAEGMWAGSFLGLLNPYSILIGILSLAMFIMHGALYMILKTDGNQQERMGEWAIRGWISFVVLYLLATVFTVFEAAYLFENLLGNALFWIFFIVFLVAMIYIPMATRGRRYFRAFMASSVTIAMLIGISAISLYPRLVPSRLNLDYSLTIYNASSTDRTLTVMLIIALIGMPLVIFYTAYIYRVFKGKTVITEGSY